jgi:enoyl-CoA hydratase
MGLLSYERSGAVATITMDDGKVNCLSPAMLHDLDLAFDRAASDDVMVVLTGRPGQFSAGFDLAVLRPDGEPAHRMVRQGFELAERLLSHSKPVVVACSGHAVGMGAFLLLSADVRIGAEGHFKITAPEVAIGLTMPQAALVLCRDRLTPPAFNRAVLVSEVYSPVTAVAAGFLDRVVPGPDLLAAARETADALGRLDLAAHAATKARARRGLLAALREGIEADQAALRFSDAARAG